MMRRSSLGGRRRASCALDPPRADAIICSTACRSIRGARTSPVRIGFQQRPPANGPGFRVDRQLDRIRREFDGAKHNGAVVHRRAKGPGIGRLSLCELPVQRFLLDPVPEGVALLPQGRQVIQRRTDRPRIRIRDQRKVDGDELEGLAVGVLHARQGGVESPVEHVVEPQIAEHESRSGENFIHTDHEPGRRYRQRSARANAQASPPRRALSSALARSTPALLQRADGRRATRCR